MDEVWSSAPSLQIDAWILKILNFFFEKYDKFFFWMDKAWLSAPSLAINVNFERKPLLEQNWSKIGLKSQNWAMLQLLGWCANQHCGVLISISQGPIGTSWDLSSCRILTCFQPFFLGHISKLKIDGECWVDEGSMSTPCKKFFPQAWQ